MILRADQLHLQFVQNDLFSLLRQTIWFRHARNLKKLELGVQPKVNIAPPRAEFHALMSRPCKTLVDDTRFGN